MDVVDTSKDFYQRTPTPTPTPHHQRQREELKPSTHPSTRPQKEARKEGMSAVVIGNDRIASSSLLLPLLDGNNDNNNVAGRNKQQQEEEVLEEATAVTVTNTDVGRGTVPSTGNAFPEEVVVASPLSPPSPPPLSPPSLGEDEERIMVMDVTSSTVAAAITVSGNEEMKIGVGGEDAVVEAVQYIAAPVCCRGRGRQQHSNGKKQKYRNGTSITMHFDNNDNYWESEYGEHKDGIIVGYDCQQWNYIVRFPIITNDNNNNNSNNINQSSFLELIPEAKIYDHLSENNACFLVKKHWGKLLMEKQQDNNGDYDDDDNDGIVSEDHEHGDYRARILRGLHKRYIADNKNTDAAYDIDWNVFLSDLNRVPKIATINILSEDNYFGLLSDEYANYPYVNVLFLAMITGPPPNTVILQLIKLNPSAINHHHIDNDHGYERFYEDCVVANPDVFLTLDPEILRILLRHTKKHEEGICFGYENYAMCLIREFLKQQMVSLSRDNDNDDDNDNYNVVISPHVKVILEENCYVVSTFLAQKYISEKSSVLSSMEDGGGIGSLLCQEVLRFALECAARNRNKCFHSKIELYRENYDTLICISLLQAMLLWLRKVDNRDLFHRYMNVYMNESNDDSMSLVNCVLDTLPRQNKMFYWGIFWNVFKDDDWEKEDATTSCSPSPRHPLLTAIRLQCHSKIISDILTKDPSILDSLDNYDSLPPFAIVAATRSYEDRIHLKEGNFCLYRNQFYGQAIICGTCANDCIYNNSQHNDIDSTYELLRMNPAVIGNNLLSELPPSITTPPTTTTRTKTTPSSSGKKNRKRSLMNARIDDGTTSTILQPLHPSKRVKKSLDNNSIDDGTTITTIARPLRSSSKRVKKSSDNTSIDDATIAAVSPTQSLCPSRRVKKSSDNNINNNGNDNHDQHSNRKNNNNLRMRFGKFLSIVTRRRRTAAAIAATSAAGGGPATNTTYKNIEQRDDSMVSMVELVVSECDTVI
ncbi:hypothetical protein FRACYDRAFT_249431 [Fragilariopsis cylindrus CCMP1102]|uniref:Uncharacterized protein n=1 Tax=Fragilariopsis cylindrus CCMP1102 TaxID=635003 RepID=A0A1E7ER96_9STRA|nr:hypothetical protein FRACYDRAFT_249431 [Fragilariopsis cylindrus CCMP1102]|eukprot:OEU08540.1 hypothetical protein FRACYDRAFT_249431 [Fragilariopsis cylindrus CCMP1102]